MSDLTGHTLGRYQVVQRLGRGGMADVYKAYQPGLDRYVAIKVMHPHLADQPEFITRFEREARAVAKLRHPNIIQVFDFDVQDDRYFMVMEYVEGSRSLKEILADLNAAGNHLELPQILAIISKVADALDYAHKQGMVHRDIKPANILLPNLENPLLSDFGIARLAGLSGLTATNMNIGTPSYMAPELGKGDSANEKSDIYALGIVLYECLTGKPPYDADTPFGVILKHINSPLVPPHTLVKHLPDDVERIVLKSLAKDPEDRFSSAIQMRDALNAAAEQAIKNAVVLEFPDLTPAGLSGIADRFESPTIIEERPVSKQNESEPDQIAAVELIREVKSPELEKEVPSIKVEEVVNESAASLVEEKSKPQKKTKAWVWGAGILGVLIIAAGIYFIITSTRANAVLELRPGERGYAICHLNGKCEELEFSTEQFGNSFQFGTASWAPDGKTFVFSVCPPGRTCGLFISDLAGNSKPLIPFGGDLNAIDPAWSQDGTLIAFHGSGALFVTDLNGKITLLAPESPRNCPFGITWSPDSQWIAWIGGECALHRNYVFTVNRNHNVISEIYYSKMPELRDGMIAWAPDGKSVVFMDKEQITTRLAVACDGQKGCSVLSRSTEKKFPVTWLRNYFPQWQIGD